jgi:uncharacterized membrane protein YgdD (TMEM256/DUF423 family)
MNSTLPFRIAAVLGFLGVALGAFGAHGLGKLLEANGHADEWDTAVLYHLIHATVLIAITQREPVGKVAWRLFSVGIVIFSGTLYIYSLTNLRWLAMITPLGGVCLLAGWLALALKRHG